MRTIDIIMAKRFGKGKKGMAVGWPLMLGVSGGTEDTVTGNAPISLPSALAKAIKSLTQTGLCTQASTPTPAAPVDIYCNNGKLMMVDDELPAGYKRVLGFSMNDNCYWKLTDFKLNGSDTLRFSFSATTSCNVIGAYSGSASGNNYSLYVATSSGNYLRYKGGAYNSTIDVDTRYDVVITPTGTTGMKTNSSWSALEFTTTTDFCVGTTSTSTSSAKMKGSFYGDIIVDGRLHLVPCERVSDNALGYYDLEGETFHAPTSGTPTSLGYDGSHYHLEIVGTNEVIWLTDGVNKLPPNAVADVRYPVAGSGATCVASCSVNDGSNLQAVEVHYYKSDGTQINYYTLNNYDSASGRMYRSFSLPSTAAYISIERKSAYSTATVTELQVKTGTTPTAYTQPYGSASAVDLLAVGDYADTQEIIGGAVTRKVGIKVFDGTETWTMATNNDAAGNKCFYTPFNDRAGGTITLTLLCTHFEQAPAASYTTLTANKFLYNSNASNKNVYFDGGSITTKDDWTAWLKAQYDVGTPVIVIYPLAEQTTESVAGQPLHTHSGDNTISVTAEVSPIALSATYIKEATA